MENKSKKVWKIKKRLLYLSNIKKEKKMKKTIFAIFATAMFMASCTSTTTETATTTDSTATTVMMDSTTVKTDTTHVDTASHK